MYRSVLVPLDRSALAEHALPLALSIARRAGARLELVQVHELYALADPAYGWMPFDPAEDVEWKQKEQLYLDGTAKWLSAVSPVVVASAVVPGLVPDAILERARTIQAGLIVMATHGRGPVGRFFLGSVADEVLRRATAPLLVVRGGDTPPSLLPEPTLDNILIPLDGSALAEQILAPAVALARLMEAHCTLLRVIDSSAAVVPRGPGGRHEGAQAEAETYLEGIAARLREENVPVRMRVVVARHPADAILEEVRAQGHDLVALATHGHGGARRMLLGSVADQVIRGVSIPVLVYRPVLA